MPKNKKHKGPKMILRFCDSKDDRIGGFEDSDSDETQQAGDRMIIMEFKVTHKGKETIERALDKISRNLSDKLDSIQKRGLCLAIMAQRAMQNDST